ncbi:MAG: ATP phosphoribosyltransferase regulatory subunit [Planctomycetota bacterium]|nr:ATP phosphoribosyltransferase regulatory subunit [Planctomycetota bacterium]
MKKVFSLYGYDPVETPAIEYMSVLSGKYGEEADHQLYRLDYKTGSKDEAGLRYDLTVPLSRLMAMAGQEVALPFRRYQIQPVWRAERAQKKQGRYREFYQCDADCIGTDSMLADAEIVAMVHRILCEVGLDDAKVKVNDRKLLRAAIAHRSFQKNESSTCCAAWTSTTRLAYPAWRRSLRSAASAPRP